MTERKGEWSRNGRGEFTYSIWTPYSGPFSRAEGRYAPMAYVFKAGRGNRWVVRVMRTAPYWLSGYDQHATMTLREGMRLARFLVHLKHGTS